MDDTVEEHANGQAPLDWPSWQALVGGIQQVLTDDGVEDALAVAADALPLSFAFSPANEKNQWRARGRVKSGDHVPYACERAGADATRQVQIALLSCAITYVGEQARGARGAD